MKILAIDVGNTRTKYHLFDGGSLNTSGVLSDFKETREIVNLFSPNKIGLSSVNPAKSDALVKELPDKYIPRMVRINSSSRLNFKLDYDTPLTLGSDRICSMAGAIALSPEAKLLLTIDSGTCITVNTIVDGVFIGGLIAPGIDTMLHAMNYYTGSLPLIEKYIPEIFDGKNTKDSMMTGVLVYIKGLVNYIKDVEIKASAQPAIYITGGNGEFLRRNIEGETSYQQHLVAIGINKITELNS